MTLANNSNGDPLVLTGDITKRNFEEKSWILKIGLKANNL
jgi:hypothetical protein